MKLLLDTHTLLWWWTDDPHLSTKAKTAISDERNQVLVSAASAWELSTKYRLGRLPEANLALAQFNDLIQADGFTHLPMTHLHAIRAGAFPFEHRDPFDRMLLAQSQLEHATLISLDPAMTALGARIFW